jgi:hypothetical protein
MALDAAMADDMCDAGVCQRLYDDFIAIRLDHDVNDDDGDMDGTAAAAAFLHDGHHDDSNHDDHGNALKRKRTKKTPMDDVAHQQDNDHTVLGRYQLTCRGLALEAIRNLASSTVHRYIDRKIYSYQ